MKNSATKKPIVFACSGRSEFGKIAGDIAQTLLKNNLATLGRIEEIANNSKNEIFIAKNSAAIIALDACEGCCTKKCLIEKNLYPDEHFNLLDLGPSTTDNYPYHAECRENYESVNCPTTKNVPRNNAYTLKPEEKEYSEESYPKVSVLEGARIIQRIFNELESIYR